MSFPDDRFVVSDGGAVAVLRKGSARDLRGVEDGSVQTVVTSPPYWGLRSYAGEQLEVWGGDPAHEHQWGAEMSKVVAVADKREKEHKSDRDRMMDGERASQGAFCACGAWYGALGLEPSPELYVSHLVEVFREVRRVLRRDGTLWLNLGDSYAGSWGNQGRKPERGTQRPINGPSITPVHDGRYPSKGSNTGAVPEGLKPKDLVGIPWAVARALRDPYYTGRIRAERDRVWLAAMIDGEGTICGFDHDRADGGGHRSGVNMTLTNTSTALLDEAHRIWPTSRSEHERPGEGHLGKRPSWRWVVNGIENKMAVIRELYPYLVVKRQQAAVAYTLLSLMADAKRLARTPQKDEVIAKRAVLTGLLSDLNQGRNALLPSWIIEPPSMYEPGWYLRSDIIWHKPNPMPESVTDRPTKAHEYLFLLSKSERYFYDADAIREPVQQSSLDRIAQNGGNPKFEAARERRENGHITGRDTLNPAQLVPANGRNKRTVWTIATRPYKGAHFATFPPDLVEPGVLAGSSPQACGVCGAPWERVTEREADKRTPYKTEGAGIKADGAGRNDGKGVRKVLREDGRGGDLATIKRTTTGWRSTCEHEDGSGACVVLDPFVGSGTTGQVALRHGRDFAGVDASDEYLTLAVARVSDHEPRVRKARRPRGAGGRT